MKKVIILIIMMLISTTSMPFVISSDIDYNIEKNKSINVENKVECDTFSVEGMLTKGSFRSQQSVNPSFKIIPTDEEYPQSKIIETPGYFNWRDYEGKDWTTPARDQAYPKYCGGCWDFAAIAALESVINIMEGNADLDPDLSEQYVLSCLPKAGGCSGGWPDKVFQYILDNGDNGNNCNGIIPEFCMPYEADDDVPCESKCEDWEDYLVPIVDYHVASTKNPETREEIIKSQIMQGGPVVTYMCVTNEFRVWNLGHHNTDDYYPYEDISGLKINHAVIIVGWKDDSSITNGGYWICKNSHGSIFGNEGFFNIEYGSLLIDSIQICWVDYNPEDYEWHPVVKVEGPFYGLTNEPVQFSASVNGEVPPYTFQWDFGNGATSDEQNPSHVFTASGEYPVSLIVTDAAGKSSVSNTHSWIQDTNSPPNLPIIEGPTRVKLNEICWYNFSVDDPDGTPFYLYFEEVFNMDSTGWWGPYYPNQGVDEALDWYWSEKGDFTVRVKAKDGYGAESDWATLQVNVFTNKMKNTPINNFIFKHTNIFSLIQILINLKNEIIR